MKGSSVRAVTLGAVVALSPAVGWAAEPWTGPEFRAFAEASDVGILRLHATWLEAAVKSVGAASLPFAVSFSYRLSPASFALDATESEGFAGAMEFGLSGAFGRSDDRFFPFGVQLSFVGPEVDRADIDYTAVGEVFGFVGYVSRAIAITAGAKIEFADGFDALGRYCELPSKPESGETPPPANPTCASDQRVSGLLVASSPWFGTVAAHAGQARAGGVGLTTMSAMARPVALPFMTAIAPYVTPGLGVGFLSGDVDFYGERLGALRTALGAGQPPPRGEDSVELSASLSNLFELGFELEATLRLVPSAAPRLVSAGWFYEWFFGEGGSGVELSLGAAAILVGREGDLGVGGEASASLWIGADDFGAELGLAYGYNSPRASPGFPVPESHVFGVQLVLGMRGSSPPLIAHGAVKGGVKEA